MPVFICRYGTKAQKRVWAGGTGGRVSHLRVTYLCRCKLKTWKRKTKGIVWGDMKAEDRHLLDITGLPFFFKASYGQRKKRRHRR